MIKHLYFILLLCFCSVSIANGQKVVELYRQMQHASHDSIRVRLYTRLADYYNTNGYTDSSLAFVQKGITLSQKINLLAYQAQLYLLLGTNYRRQMKRNEAIRFLLKSKTIAMRLHQNALLEKAGYALAATYASNGDYKPSIKQIFENLDFAKKNGSNLRLSANYSLLASLNTQYGNDSLAHYYARKTWQADISNPATEADRYEGKLLMLVDSVEIQLKRYNREFAYKLIEEFIKTGNAHDAEKGFFIATLEDMARTCAKYNYNQKALDLFNYIIAFTSNQPLDRSELLRLSIYPAITKIYLKQNNLPQAILWHNKSRLLIDSPIFLKNVLRASKKIDIIHNEAIILEKKGFYKKALANLHLLETLEYNLNLKKKEIEFLQISVLGELEANQQKVHSLNDQIEIQKLIQENDKRKNSFLITLIVFLLILVILTFLFLRHITAKHKLVLAQKAKIEAQSVELDDANQVKDKLFSIIGHDLRSPVADLLAGLETANSLKPTKMKQYVCRMQDKIQFLYYTIDNLLNWSVTHLNPRQAPLKLINFKEAISQTILLLESGASKKNITIINQVEDTSGYTNEIQQQVILRNILGNAIKFTPREGFIKIYTIHQKEWIGIAIRDSGEGMAKEIIQNIHNYQESKPGTAGEKGTGLGLRLSRELIEKQGGMIKIKSQTGKGTLVELYFKNSLSPQPVLN